MADLEEAVILSEIAGMVADHTTPDSDAAFLYAEAEDGMVGPALFQDMGDVVRYIAPSLALSLKIMDLWDAADETKKWAALFLTIQGDQFDVRFQYPGEWGDEDEGERRDRVLGAKYGNKRIVYGD